MDSRSESLAIGGEFGREVARTLTQKVVTIMNTRESIFDNFLLANGFGGRYAHETDPIKSHRDYYDILINGIYQHVSEFRASPECLKPFPEIFAGIAKCTAMNACAFRFADTFYVAVCRGVF